MGPIWRRWSLLLVGLLVLAGCQLLRPGTPAPATLKVGLLPIVDVLPMYVAEAEGYFREENLSVDLVLFASALERDAAFQAKQLDLQLNDMISAILLNKDGEQLRIVRLTHQGSPSKALVYILAAPNSPARSAADLRGQSLALSSNTVIEYAVDRLFRQQGLDPASVQKVEVTRIPLRVEMLIKGQVAAAALPEPMASLALQQGARLLLDDSQSGVGHSVLSVRQDVLAGQPEAVRRFLRAYERAVTVINAQPEKYRPLLIEKARVPESLRESFTVPRYPAARVPTPAEVQDVMEWMVSKGLIPAAIPYEKMVSDAFLPR